MLERKFIYLYEASFITGVDPLMVYSKINEKIRINSMKVN